MSAQLGKGVRVFIGWAPPHRLTPNTAACVQGVIVVGPFPAGPIAAWPGETVLDYFGGLMTVPERAIRLKRKGIGIELGTQYFLDGLAYCEAAEREISMPSLFDVLDDGAAA